MFKALKFAGRMPEYALFQPYNPGLIVHMDAYFRPVLLRDRKFRRMLSAPTIQRGGEFSTFVPSATPTMQRGEYSGQNVPAMVHHASAPQLQLPSAAYYPPDQPQAAAPMYVQMQPMYVQPVGSAPPPIYAPNQPMQPVYGNNYAVPMDAIPANAYHQQYPPPQYYNNVGSPTRPMSTMPISPRGLPISPRGVNHRPVMSQQFGPVPNSSSSGPNSAPNSAPVSPRPKQ